MKKLALVLAAALPIFVGAGRTSAQTIEAGQWTGIITEPGGDRTEVLFDVTVKGDTIGIVARSNDGGNFPFTDVKLVDDRTITFWFTPGPRVECRLTRGEDGSYEGPCRAPNGMEARMLMVPPKIAPMSDQLAALSRTQVDARGARMKTTEATIMIVPTPPGA